MMKFLLFNVVVVAALGFILYERGDLDGSRAGAVVSDAKDYVHTQLSPTPEFKEEPLPIAIKHPVEAPSVVRAPISTRVVQKEPVELEPVELDTVDPNKGASAASQGASVYAPPSEASAVQQEASTTVLQERAVNPVTRAVKEGPPIKSAPVVAVEQVASATTPQNAAIQAGPRALVREVAPEVEARRAELLGSATSDMSQQGASNASNRLQKLQDLAEEMEFLSVDLIYQ